MVDLDKITKLIFDEQAFAILKAVSQTVKTTKEIAKELNVSVSNLYYKINKLLSIDALRIVSQLTSGNIIEYSYSSEHLFNQPIIINKESLKDHFSLFLQFYLIQQKKMLHLLQTDIADESNSNEDNVKLIFGSVQLSPEDWKEFNQLVGDFLKSKNTEASGITEQIEVIIAAGRTEKL